MLRSIFAPVLDASIDNSTFCAARVGAVIHAMIRVKRARSERIRSGRPHWHLKLRASLGSPWPVYWACLGYAHNGRLRPGNAFPVAMTDSGETPFSVQFTTA